MDSIETYPPVSIVMPVRDEVDSVRRAIDSCLAQTYAGDIEIVVADAMSTDGTRDVVLGYSEPHAVHLLDNPDMSTPAGLNAAIRGARGEIIVRCDAHSVLPPGYVETAVRSLIDTGAGNVGGIQKAIGTTPLQRGIAAAMTNPIGVGDAKFHRGGSAGPVDTVYLGTYPKEILVEVGGFDESLVRNQDYELNIRIREAGHTVWFDPDLVVEYAPRPSLGALWRQYSDYGQWKRKVVALHPSSLKARQAAPPLLVVGLAASAVSLATPLRRVGASALIGYMAALGAAGVYEAARRRDVAALIATPAIGVMHVAWGVGFLTAGRRVSRDVSR